MGLVILLTFLLKTPSGVQVEDLAVVKDMETCKTIAAVLNAQMADDPNAGVVCREAKPAERS